MIDFKKVYEDFTNSKLAVNIGKTYKTAKIDVIQIIPFLETEGPEREEIINVYRISLPQNAEFFAAKLLTSKNKEIDYIGSIQKLNITEEVVEITLSNGFKCYLPIKDLEKGISDHKELTDFIESLKQDYLHYFRLKMIDKKGKKGKISIKKVPLRIVEHSSLIKRYEDINKVLKFIQEHNLKHWQALLLFLGIKIDDEKALLLNLARIASLFRVYIGQGNPHIHVLQFTHPGMGKTSFYAKLTGVINAEIIAGLPSRARLIYDSAKQNLGLVFLRDFIILDEFDKTFKDKSKLEDFISYTNTGMSNGLWSRETSSTINVSSTKMVGFVFLGNIPSNLTLASDYVHALKSYLINVVGLQAGAVISFIDRLGFIDINPIRINTNALMLDYTIKAWYLRTYLKYLEEKINSLELDYSVFSDLEKRQYYHAVKLYHVMVGLEITKNPEIIKLMVLGQEKWRELLLKELRGEEISEKIDYEKAEIFEEITVKEEPKTPMNKTTMTVEQITEFISKFTKKEQ